MQKVIQVKARKPARPTEDIELHHESSDGIP